MLNQLKAFLKEVIDLGLLVIALGIILQVVFGDSMPFIGGDIVGNIMAILTTLGNGGLVGLIALAIIIYLINKQSA